jgi:hypothetical protein
MQYYRQCVLVKGKSQQVSWIPEQFAVVDEHVMLRGDDGWLVTQVYGHRQDHDYVMSHERDYLGHRSRTDI